MNSSPLFATGMQNGSINNPVSDVNSGNLGAYLAAHSRKKATSSGPASRQGVNDSTTSDATASTTGNPRIGKRHKLIAGTGIAIGGTAAITGISHMSDIIEALKTSGLTGGSLITILVVLLLFNVPAIFIQWRNSQDDRRERQADREERKELFGAIFEIQQHTASAILQNTTALNRLESTIGNHSCHYYNSAPQSSVHIEVPEDGRKRRHP